ERAALKAVRDLFAAAARSGEVIAVTRALQDFQLLLGGLAGERIARVVVEREQLRLAHRRDRKRGYELAERLGVGEAAGAFVGPSARRFARHQHVAPEGLARKEHAAGQPERGVELALEGGLEPLDLDAEIAQKPFGDVAVVGLGGIDRFAAAVADHETAIERELVALGMATEIIVVVEDEDARGRPGDATIEGGGRQSADARADDDEVVTLLDRQPVEREALAFARLHMRGLERARMLSAQSGECGRIAQRLRRDLCRWRKAGGDGQSHAIEEVAARNRRHGEAKSPSGWTTVCRYASTDRNPKSRLRDSGS